jgi:hypothetical protein
MTATIPTGAAARPYKLISFNRYWNVLRTDEYDSLEDLAYAAFRASYYLEQNARDWFGPSSYAAHQKAVTPRGRPLAIAELVAWGGSIAWARHVRQSRRTGYIWREGSVPGIRKWRGGPCDRNYRVQSERRLNELVVTEDGEVPARNTRRGFNLPDSWDGRPRTRQRCWKKQFKGRKSWDRPALRGKVESC